MNPMTGKGAWVWYAASCGTVEQMIAQAHAAGLSHVIIKVGDGAGFGDQHDGEIFRRQVVELLPRLRAAGLRVLTWSYNYLDDPAGEAAVANWALSQDGVAGHVFDVEAEAEGKPAAAAAMLAAVRAAHPDAWLAYAPLPVIDFHAALPYWQFNAVCQAVCPQFYPNDLGAQTWPLWRLWAQWDRWLKTWQGWGGAVPELLPVVEGYLDGSAAVIKDFAGQAQQRSESGFSVWSWQHFSGEVWTAIAEAPPAGMAAVTPTPPAETNQVAQAAALAHLKEAEQHIAWAQDILQRQAAPVATVG